MKKKFWRTKKISKNYKTQWQILGTKEREQEYNPSSIIGGNYSPFLNEYLTNSSLAREKYKSIIYKYSEKSSNLLEFVSPANKRKNKFPLIVFFHGGYWQELSIKESFFPAIGFVENNFAFAAIDYTLAPKASLTEIVNECNLAIKWISKNAEFLGIDPDKIVVSGSSAGAHLASMVVLNNKIYDLNILGSILISGIYELEPLIGTNINELLSLNNVEAKLNSPILKNTYGFPPSLIVYGEMETLEFKRQSNSFINKLLDTNCYVKLLEISKKNHFDVILNLSQNSTLLGSEVFNFLNILEAKNAKI